MYVSIIICVWNDGRALMLKGYCLLHMISISAGCFFVVNESHEKLKKKKMSVQLSSLFCRRAQTDNGRKLLTAQQKHEKREEFIEVWEKEVQRGAKCQFPFVLVYHQGQRKGIFCAQPWKNVYLQPEIKEKTQSRLCVHADTVISKVLKVGSYFSIIVMPCSPVSGTLRGPQDWHSTTRQKRRTKSVWFYVVYLSGEEPVESVWKVGRQ